MKSINRHYLIGQSPSRAFTIVELLVVVVIIAVLAAISLVMYSGISQKAVASVLQSDLSNAATTIKAFEVENGSFPVTISTNCSTSPDTATNKCLKISGNNSYVGYASDNTSSPKTFLLLASNGTTTYKVTDSSAPVQLAQTQPGITPGATLELYASKANSGTGPGINSPFTGTWNNLGGSASATLSSFAATTASGWAGSGTGGDPYRLVFDCGNDNTYAAGPAGGSMPTVEIWVRNIANGTANTALWVDESYGIGKGWLIYLPTTGVASLEWNWATPSVGHDWHSWSGALSTVSFEQLVFTYDGTNLQLYRNGAPSGGPYAHSYTPRNGTIITGSATGSGAKFEVAAQRIYPFALTAAQVAANYSAGIVW